MFTSLAVTKIEGLKNLAMTCWNEVIPEYGTDTFQNTKVR